MRTIIKTKDKVNKTRRDNFVVSVGGVAVAAAKARQHSCGGMAVTAARRLKRGDTVAAEGWRQQRGGSRITAAVAKERRWQKRGRVAAAGERQRRPKSEGSRSAAEKAMRGGGISAARRQKLLLQTAARRGAQ